MSKISLCVITGNEAAYVERFLGCFAKDFDELCVVRALGNLPQDNTVSRCKKWCEANGKAFRFEEYCNAGWSADAVGQPVAEDDPATWRHVDDFAAARNLSWSLATGEWQFWADFDDVLAPDSAGLIRENAESGRADYYFFTYNIGVSSESNMRERLFRCGESSWGQPIHENVHVRDQAKRWHHDARVIYSHEPDEQKVRDPERNRRIAEFHLRYLNAFAPEIQREYFWKWQADRKPADLEKATRWAEISNQCDIFPEQKVSLLLNMSAAAAVKDRQHALDLAWSAARLMPWQREPWGVLAEHYLAGGDAQRADFMATLMQGMRRPPPSGMPMSKRFYETDGFYLKLRTLRACGREEAARAGERSMFEQHGARFSLLHATRGRPEKALQARSDFLRAAISPFGVEHIFAIDEDDAESLAALKLYRHVIVKEPRGCVKAWNAAAAVSEGKVLVQLSDDWIPCIHWDELMWLALGDAALKRLGQPLDVPPVARANAIASVPLVLAVSDNHRTDALLCCAILTRARYEQQSETVTMGKDTPCLFSPEYFGVFSDNEFTHRAQDAGCMVQAPHILLDHKHPIFEGKKWEEMDATYRRQNAAERYAEGKEIFNRRNPAHAIP